MNRFTSGNVDDVPHVTSVPRQWQCATGDNVKGRSMWDRQWGKSSNTPGARRSYFKCIKQIGCNDAICKFAPVFRDVL